MTTGALNIRQKLGDQGFFKLLFGADEIRAWEEETRDLWKRDETYVVVCVYTGKRLGKRPGKRPGTKRQTWITKTIKIKKQNNKQQKDTQGRDVNTRQSMSCMYAYVMYVMYVMYVCMYVCMYVITMCYHVCMWSFMLYVVWMYTHTVQYYIYMWWMQMQSYIFQM